MFVVVANFILNFDQVHQENVRRCQFSVMFTDFGQVNNPPFNPIKLGFIAYNSHEINDHLKS